MSADLAPALADAAYQRDLPGGLRLRWSTLADIDALIDLYHAVFLRDDGSPDPTTIALTRDMGGGRHPLLDPTDFALVEDTAAGQIVAAACLMRQTWEIGGVPVAIGRPEVVATRRDYRRRGLIRAIFELIHARSAVRADLVQAITGIHYFYRQFGYEYALDLGGGRALPFSAIPKLKEGESEPYNLRPATPDDLPLLLDLYRREQADAFVHAVIDDPYWRFVMTEADVTGSREHWRSFLIADRDGRPVGYALTRPARWGASLPIRGLAVAEGVSLAAALPSVLRAVRAMAGDFVADADAPPPDSIMLSLGAGHPAYDALGPLLPPPSRRPYAWYIRAPDLPALVQRLAPVLEARLATSPFAGYTGELRLTFFRDGLRLAFEQGRLSAAEDWRAPEPEDSPRPTASFPPLTFLQLLFGHRSLAELRHIFPDAWANDETAPLLDALFPRQLSRCWSLE